MYFLEHGSREGSYCISLAEALCLEKNKQANNHATAQIPLWAEEMFMCALNSILSRGLSKDVFSHLP